MGLRLKNIITDYKSEEDITFIREFEKSFQFVQAKRFNAQFQGIIGQIDERKIEQNCYDEEFLQNNNCRNLDDVFEIIYEFEDKISVFSEKFPNKSFVYIDVDCFGGTCLYKGFIVKNGEISYRQESTYDGHIKLLERLNQDFKEWNFEPFSRDFFTKRGEINGKIYDFSIAGLWLALKNDYSDTTKYYIDGSANGLLLKHNNNYTYYFKPSNQNIEITGVIYNDDAEMVNEILSVPDNSFQGMDYELEITFSERTNVVKKTSNNNVNNDRGK